jgi:hypothetical protein
MTLIMKLCDMGDVFWEFYPYKTLIVFLVLGIMIASSGLLFPKKW